MDLSGQRSILESLLDYFSGKEQDALRKADELGIQVVNQGDEYAYQDEDEEEDEEDDNEGDGEQQNLRDARLRI